MCLLWAKVQLLPGLLLMQPWFVPWEPVPSLWIPSQMRCKKHRHTHRYTLKQMFVKGCLPLSLCINVTLWPLVTWQCIKAGDKQQKHPSTSESADLTAEILAVPIGLKCHTFKIIRLKWIESAGLSPHEWTAETRWWRGMIMSPCSSQC